MRDKQSNVALYLFLIWFAVLIATIVAVSVVDAPRATGYGAIFAGISAIAAAAIAYKGATSKAELDREIDIRNEYRSKLNLHLIADQALASLEDQCRGEGFDSLALATGKKDTMLYVPKKRYRLIMPQRIESVWSDLGSFNDPLIITSFRKLGRALDARSEVEMEIGRRPSVKRSEIDVGREIPFELFKEFIETNLAVFNEARVLRGLIHKDIPYGNVAHRDRVRFVLAGTSVTDPPE